MTTNTNSVCTSCTTDTCGIGTGNVPLPGDPDNTISISARTVTGGIMVSWTYPRVNPQAVAYSTLFRSTTNKLSDAVEVGQVAGGQYYDPLKPEKSTMYYYWIQITSIHGTTNEIIGPASALAKSRAEELSDDLSGEIDDGYLSGKLKTNIEKITLNYNELVDEISKRIAGNAALSAALAEVRAGQAEAIGLVHSEIITRKEGQNALASKLDTVAAVNQTNAAAILEERTARVTADDAQARQITQLFAATANAAAAVVEERNVRTAQYSSLANQISTVQSTLNGNIASVRQTMETRINELNGEMDALVTFQVDVNGNVGGFGIHGTGQRIEAGFDVDRFWVGRGNVRQKPFIIDNGIVYIDKARIREATIDTLHLTNGAVSALNANRSSGQIEIPAKQIRNITSTSIDMTVNALPGGSVGTTGKVMIQAFAGIVFNIVTSSVDEDKFPFPPTAIWAEIVRNGVVIATQKFGGVGAVNFMFLDTAPINGINTYTLNISNDSYEAARKFWVQGACVSAFGMKR